MRPSFASFASLVAVLSPLYSSTSFLPSFLSSFLPSCFLLAYSLNCCCLLLLVAVHFSSNPPLFTSTQQRGSCAHPLALLFSTCQMCASRTSNTALRCEANQRVNTHCVCVLFFGGGAMSHGQRTDKQTENRANTDTNRQTQTHRHRHRHTDTQTHTNARVI